VSKYNREHADRILELLSQGKTLTSICKSNPELPAVPTVISWAMDAENPFAEQYARARMIGYHVMGDQTLDEADGAGNEPGEVASARLRVDTRKWLLSKCLPKIYGDKVTHQGDQENPIQTAGRIEIVVVDPNSKG
jgi:hypothetical protein